MSDADLNALEVGLLRLDDDGHITFVNEGGRALPGLDDAPREALVGTSLFLQVPATSNALFLDPFREGVETGSIDTRFPYAFVSPGHPPMPFHVHLYRAGPSQANWLLLRAA
jgi:photoactive yellow protein